MGPTGSYTLNPALPASMVHNHNRAQVWEAMRTHSPASLGDLARETSLSRATISAIVREMLQVGLLESEGPAESSGGRPAALFRYTPEARLAVGITMFENQITAVLTDLEGRPLQFRECAWEGTSPEHLLRAMAGAVTELTAGIEPRRIIGAGVGLPGIIDVPTGRILMCISMDWLEPVEARRMLEDSLGMPVFLANRSRIAALGELRAGVGRGCNSLLYMFIGRGVVAGIAFADGIYFGATSSAGEIGHTTVVPDGPRCRCGNRGCLELYTSEAAIVATAIARAREHPDSALRRVTQGNLQVLTIDHLISCAQEGDAAALATFDEVGTYLGISLAGALNILNPEMLVVGGPVGCKAGDLLLGPTRRELERRTLAITLSAARIVTGSSDDEFAALGAAGLALNAVSVGRIFTWDGTA